MLHTTLVAHENQQQQQPKYVRKREPNAQYVTVYMSMGLMIICGANRAFGSALESVGDSVAVTTPPYDRTQAGGRCDLVSVECQLLFRRETIKPSVLCCP